MIYCYFRKEFLLFLKNQSSQGNLRGVVANGLNCNFLVTLFKDQSCHYVNFWTNKLGKSKKALISPPSPSLEGPYLPPLPALKALISPPIPQLWRPLSPPPAMKSLILPSYRLLSLPSQLWSFLSPLPPCYEVPYLPHPPAMKSLIPLAMKSLIPPHQLWSSLSLPHQLWGPLSPQLWSPFSLSPFPGMG